MNDFTRIFRKVAFEILDQGFKGELRENLPNRDHIDNLFKEAFPTNAAEDKVIMSAINSMQYTMGMFLLQVRADHVPGFDGEQLTMFLHGMGAVLLGDLEEQETP
jgi:hypothetical protein